MVRKIIKKMLAPIIVEIMEEQTEQILNEKILAILQDYSIE